MINSCKATAFSFCNLAFSDFKFRSSFSNDNNFVLYNSLSFLRPAFSNKSKSFCSLETFIVLTLLLALYSALGFLYSTFCFSFSGLPGVSWGVPVGVGVEVVDGGGGALVSFSFFISFF